MTSIRDQLMSRPFKPLFVAVVLLASAQSIATAQSGSQSTINVYGFVMLDAGYNLDQINPNWTDVVRPSKLPSFKNQFAPDGSTFFGVRQTRLGVKGNVPTPIGDLKTTFEFELFGTGVDEGQTTFRLRHAYGELGHFGAGQTWSPFMDIDVFPNSLEYWGPTGMVFFRNLQVRWMPIQGDSRMTIALERPGACADQGAYAGRVELQDVKPRFPYPDLSAEYRYGRKWGYVELAGMLRRIEWKDQGADAFNLTGDATGWGVNLSSNLNLGKSSVARLQAMYGEGVENYMNDAPADIGIENQPGNPVAPVKGVPLPVTGVVAFLDHSWNTKLTTAVGYSMVDIDNSAQQAPDAFSKAQYALGNLLYSPTPGVTAGVEFQWGNRDNFSDGFTSDIRKIQFSFKYAFSKTY
jgi:hypothetical protein